MRPFILLSALLVGAGLLLVGCDKQKAYEVAQGWPVPIKVTESKDSLVDGVDLYKWHSTIIALQGLDDRSARCFLMNQDSNSWSEVPFLGVPHGDYLWAYPTMDQSGEKVFFQQGHMENNQLKMGVLLENMRADTGRTRVPHCLPICITNKVLLRRLPQCNR